MSHLTLEHVKPNELPPNWVQQLPAARTFTVTITAENWEQQPSTPEPVTIAPSSYNMRQDDNVSEEEEAYLQYLHSQGIDIGRLRESIKEYEAGKAEILDWNEFEKE